MALHKAPAQDPSWVWCNRCVCGKRCPHACNHGGNRTVCLVWGVVCFAPQALCGFRAAALEADTQVTALQGVLRANSAGMCRGRVRTQRRCARCGRASLPAAPPRCVAHLAGHCTQTLIQSDLSCTCLAAHPPVCMLPVSSFAVLPPACERVCVHVHNCFGCYVGCLLQPSTCRLQPALDVEAAGAAVCAGEAAELPP